MGYTRNIADLITEVRELSDMEETEFVTDDEITRYLNQAYRDIYNILVQSYEMYKVTSDDTTTVAGTKDYSLPSDFLKLVKVYYVNGTNEYPLRRMTLHEPDSYGRIYSTAYRYTLLGDNFRLHPTPNTADTIRLYYVPAATAFTKTSTNIDFGQHMDEYCVVFAAVKCLEKEKSPTNELIADRQMLRQKCIEAADPRDFSEPASVMDTEYDRIDFWENLWAR